MASCTCHKIASYLDGMIKVMGGYPFDKILMALE